ncbi:MAG: hypothetical protein K0Q77_3140 [Anaerosporomusa subterranea]|nr:hypothetical protein [Anaerosporomusa subterranea]
MDELLNALSSIANEAEERLKLIGCKDDSGLGLTVVISRCVGAGDYEQVLSSKLAVDGLHLDIEGKKKIAAAVNVNWVRITGLPW